MQAHGLNAVMQAGAEKTQGKQLQPDFRFLGQGREAVNQDPDHKTQGGNEHAQGDQGQGRSGAERDFNGNKRNRPEKTGGQKEDMSRKWRVGFQSKTSENKVQSISMGPEYRGFKLDGQ